MNKKCGSTKNNNIKQRQPIDDLANESEIELQRQPIGDLVNASEIELGEIRTRSNSN